MIVDSSALVAIVNGEPEAAEFLDVLSRNPNRRMSAATYVETSIVIDGQHDPVASRQLDELIERAHIEMMSLTQQQARIAREAYRDFGKTSGSRAKLNFGDCFSYALAKDLDEPLLFKGDDFNHTDVRRAR